MLVLVVLTLYLKVEPLAHSFFNLHHYTAAANNPAEIIAKLTELRFVTEKKYWEIYDNELRRITAGQEVEML